MKSSCFFTLFLTIAWFASVPALSAADAPEYFNGLAHPNGKQIARYAGGWLVVTTDPSGREAVISVAPAAKVQTALASWKQVRFVAADDLGLFHSDAPSAVPPSLAVDHRGRLHVAWDSGKAVCYARTPIDAAKGAPSLTKKESWTGADGQPPQPILEGAKFGDLALSGEGEPWITAVKSGAGRLTTACVGGCLNGKWSFEDLAQDVGFHPPALELLPDRSAAVVWSDTRGRVYYVRYQPGKKAEPKVLCNGGFTPNGRRPQVISNGRQTIVAYENWYAQIEYAVEEGGQWRLNQRLTSLDPRFMMDVVHSPQLVLDRQGVIWLFFSDGTRRFTYFTRWLGSTWSDIYDGRGIYYRTPRFEADFLAADWFCAEKHPAPGAENIGIALANSLAAGKSEFHRIQVPAPVAAVGSETLFLDMLELAAVDGAELTLDEAQRNPNNPLMRPGAPGSFDQDRVFNHGSVVYDGDRFRMWYGGVHRQPGHGWWEWLSIGYAESRDGLTWEKTATGEPETPGDTGLNRLRELPWPCAVFLDPADPNPKQRYKVVQFNRHQLQEMASLRGEYDMEDPIVPGQLSQSPDGVHWSTEPVSISFVGAGKPWELVVQSFFIDRAEPDPTRRWKVYGYATLAARRRAACFAYSADGRNWTGYPRNPILDPTVSEVPMIPSGPEAQIHDTVVFPYQGYYLALFHAEHDGNFLDVELAVSRDGEHFAHVKPGHKVITLGKKGDWDWQQILQSRPVIAQDKLWIYYGGLSPPPDLLAAGRFDNNQIVGSAGLATLRLDGFTHLGLKAGQASGSITTVPYQLAGKGPLSLVINADCGEDRSIAVELLDAETGHPIPGFTQTDCTPLTRDGLRDVVRWRGGDRLPVDRKSIAVRIFFSGKESSAKLYGFGFVDAKGGIELQVEW